MKRVFTLVEVMCVAATIAIMTAMLLPAVSSARNKATAGACLSNQRQLGQAFQMFLMENKHTLPNSTVKPEGKGWLAGTIVPNALSDNNVVYSLDGGLIFSQVEEKGIFRCEATPDDKPVSFSMNQVLSGRKVSGIRKPTDAPLLLEELTNDDGNFTLVNYYLTEQGTLGVKSSYIASRNNSLGNRHNGHDHVLFLDSHANAVNWSNDKCWLECLRVDYKGK